MDHPESTTLASVLAQVPDPRKRRGKRHAWTFLWTTICTAVLSDQRTPHAIAHWILLHAEELIARLQPARRQVPSESTVRRAFRHVDLTALEQQLTQFTQHLPPPGAATPPAAPPCREYRPHAGWLAGRLRPPLPCRCALWRWMARPCVGPGCMDRGPTSSA